MSASEHRRKLEALEGKLVAAQERFNRAWSRWVRSSNALQKARRTVDRLNRACQAALQAHKEARQRKEA